MTKRRLILIAAVFAGAAALPLIGYLVLADVGLLVAVAVVQVLTIGMIVRVWLSLDLSAERLRKQISSSNLRGFRKGARQLVEQFKAERQATAERLLEHERRFWEIHRDTLRQVEIGLQTERDEIKRRYEVTTHEIEARLRAEFAQVEALLALYHEIRPEVAFPATRSWVASPDLLRHLYDRVRTDRPRLILECGSGLSTVIMAHAIRRAGFDGRVVALEHLEEFAERTRGMLADHGLTDVAEVRLAPLSDVEIDGEPWPWYEMSCVPDEPIDLLFVDGPPGATHEEARYPAVPLVRTRLHEGSTVLLDDLGREDESHVAARWVEEHDGLELRELPHEKGTAVLTVKGSLLPRSPESSSIPESA